MFLHSLVGQLVVILSQGRLRGTRSMHVWLECWHSQSGYFSHAADLTIVTSVLCSVNLLTWWILQLTCRVHAWSRLQWEVILCMCLC